MRNRAAGFTLLEVLVALAVLAITMGALIKGGADNAANAAYLRDKTFAQWVGMNRITLLQVQPQWPAVGKRSGTEELAGREWRWTAEISKTVDDSVHRVEVRVRRSDDDADSSVAEVVGFLPKPSTPQPGAPVPPGSAGGSNGGT